MCTTLGLASGKLGGAGLLAIGCGESRLVTLLCGGPATWLSPWASRVGGFPSLGSLIKKTCKDSGLHTHYCRDLPHLLTPPLSSLPPPSTSFPAPPSFLFLRFPGSGLGAALPEAWFGELGPGRPFGLSLLASAPTRFRIGYSGYIGLLASLMIPLVAASLAHSPSFRCFLVSSTSTACACAILSLVGIVPSLGRSNTPFNF